MTGTHIIAVDPTASDISRLVTKALDNWTDEYALKLDVCGCKLTLTCDGFTVYIEHISVPRALRQRGLASAMLTAVTAWADRGGETLRLHMSVEFGTDQDVLSRFYGRHGFVALNRIGGMVREPASASN